MLLTLPLGSGRVAAVVAGGLLWLARRDGLRWSLRSDGHGGFLGLPLSERSTREEGVPLFVSPKKTHRARHPLGARAATAAELVLIDSGEQQRTGLTARKRSLAAFLALVRASPGRRRRCHDAVMLVQAVRTVDLILRFE